MVGPVDLQNVVSKAANVQRVQHQQQHQPVVDIQEFAQDASEKASLKEKQVSESPSSEEAKLEEKQQGDSEGKKQLASEETTAAEEEKRLEETIASDPERGLHIDIKA